jgi:hypothetical protein
LEHHWLFGRNTFRKLKSEKHSSDHIQWFKHLRMTEDWLRGSLHQQSCAMSRRIWIFLYLKFLLCFYELFFDNTQSKLCVIIPQMRKAYSKYILQLIRKDKTWKIWKATVNILLDVRLEFPYEVKRCKRYNRQELEVWLAWGDCMLSKGEALNPNSSIAKKKKKKK